jgi:hypothetical protein
MKTLLYDRVIQRRATFQFRSFDSFYTIAEAYDSFNATHTRKRWASASRQVFDQTTDGKDDVDSSSGVDYFLSGP